MFPADPLKPYPNLAAYFNATLTPPGPDAPAVWSMSLAGVSTGLMVMSILPVVGPAFLALGFVGFASAVGVMTRSHYWPFRKIPNEDIRLKEAKVVAANLRQMITTRRFHRDLDPATVALLEDSARLWNRVRTALDHDFWNGAEVPPTYAVTRQQALRAADEGMADILLLYKPNLPQKVESRPVLDYVAEAAENFGFTRPQPSGDIPPAYEPAREVHAKLARLAEEAERIAAAGRRIIPNAPGQSLDVVLGELRALREAESELDDTDHLRQRVNG